MAKGQITIIGMDQVGVSLVLAIKQQRPEAFIVGADSRLELLRDAMKTGQLDRNDTNLVVACREAGLIIVTSPVSRLRDIFSTIGPELLEGAVVIDLSSVKAEVLKMAEELLPQTVKHLGCHLILHPDAADRFPEEPHADLFHGSILVMTPTPNTDEIAIKTGSNLATTIGARPYFMDVFEHDGLLAAVEGLPGLISASMLLAVTRSRAWDELSQIAGAVFAQATLPASHPSIDGGAALTMNKAEVLRWLDTFLEALRDVRQVVDEGNSEKLNQMIVEANQLRLEWLSAKPMTPWNDQDAMPEPPHELRRMDLMAPKWGQDIKDARGK
jgi:prephenate dehydrogenase